MNKIEDAQRILKDLGLSHFSQQISALTLLALCNVKPGDDWKSAQKKSLTLSNGIMDFARSYYNADYKPNTRESFRKFALKPFVDNGIADLNPDNPDLSPQSSRTHYAISDIALKTIQEFGSDTWDAAAKLFRDKVQLSTSSSAKIFLKTITVKNFKSIVESTIELGRVNVFIGTNGCGKTNILETLAFVGASRVNDLNYEGLYSRGVRITRPNLFMSSFSHNISPREIEIDLEIDVEHEKQTYHTSLRPVNPDYVYSAWYDINREEDVPELLLEYMKDVLEKRPNLKGEDLLSEVNKLIGNKGIAKRRIFDDLLKDYSIYDLNTKSLRGIIPAESRKTPLGLNGENLDSFLATFDRADINKISQQTKCFFDWFDSVVANPSNPERFEGLKAGKSVSNLFFTDKYMRERNNTLSAENSNEGILHVLFYLSLFMSDKTPKLFAIDNIETALNPKLCRVLIKTLVLLAKETDKQILITTHNPALLDGLNVLDEEQRLFEVFRNDFGHTQTRRIIFKSDLSDKTAKLSDMWLSGALGGVPNNF